ncbi:hypothetical protein RS08_03 [Gammahymrhavirus longicaudata]|uniref:Uncharacterized protein n=1 Tax=Diachasmimorpha longicaudata rhabdovirus TaxID=1585246 RepID=A0A0X9J973_9RHAB|nr:hypothetical protein RS08_03 [Diachasmimorpha longicaudata rhabdovirus]ALU09126.1 hypothetical protein RS08_03 [Diachasmimorpha longicaudata rhabdovirus]
MQQDKMGYSVSFTLKGHLKIINCPKKWLDFKYELSCLILSHWENDFPCLLINEEIRGLYYNVLVNLLEKKHVMIRDGVGGYDCYIDLISKGFLHKAMRQPVMTSVKQESRITSVSFPLTEDTTILVKGIIQLIQCPFKIDNWEKAVAQGYRPFNNMIKKDSGGKKNQVELRSISSGPSTAVPEEIKIKNLLYNWIKKH